MIIFLFKWLGEGRGTPSSSFGRQEQKNYQITWPLFVNKDMYCQKTKGPKTLTGWLSKGSFRSMSPKVSEQMQAILYCWFLLLKAIIIRRKKHQPVVKSMFSFFFFFLLKLATLAWRQVVASLGVNKRNNLCKQNKVEERNAKWPLIETCLHQKLLTLGCTCKLIPSLWYKRGRLYPPAIFEQLQYLP